MTAARRVPCFIKGRSVGKDVLLISADESSTFPSCLASSARLTSSLGALLSLIISLLYSLFVAGLAAILSLTIGFFLSSVTTTGWALLSSLMGLVAASEVGGTIYLASIVSTGALALTMTGFFLSTETNFSSSGLGALASSG